MTRPQKLLSKTTEKMILKESKRKPDVMIQFFKLTGSYQKILNCFIQGDCFSNKRLSEITGINTAHITRYLQYLTREKWLEKFECTQCCQTALYRRIK